MRYFVIVVLLNYQTPNQTHTHCSSETPRRRREAWSSFIVLYSARNLLTASTQTQTFV